MKFTGKIQEKDDFQFIIDQKNNQVDFINLPHKPGRYYDSVRIKIERTYTRDGQAIGTDGRPYKKLLTNSSNDVQPLYRIKVSWYGQNDAILIDNAANGYYSGRRDDFEEIVAGLDINKINYHDKEYCLELANELLDHDRVQEYLTTGLQDNPREEKRQKGAAYYGKGEKCGNYVGHVSRNHDGRYRKVFNGYVGQMIHDSDELVQKRTNYDLAKLDSLDKQSEDIKNKIMELQKSLGIVENQRKSIKKRLDSRKKNNDYDHDYME